MARKGSNSGRIARHLAFGTALAGLLGGVVLTVVVMAVIPGLNTPQSKRGWMTGLGLSFVFAGLTGAAGHVLGSKVGQRVTDLGLAVGKLGRGASEVKVRVGGDDEVTALGRAVQYLAADLQVLLKDQDEGGGSIAHVSMDPQVKQLRDRTVPKAWPEIAGYEGDGQLVAGSRGGLDYFDLLAAPGDTASGTAYVVSAEGHGALSIYACRVVRDALHQALAEGQTPRKALVAANKAAKAVLPTGCCAKATLLQFGPEGGKLYQAGARTPLLIAQRGELMELNAEGIALGLDDGPVFEKSLRPQEIELVAGTRLVLGNDALLRCEGALDLLREHSPKHTRMFMNVVLSSLEQDAGDDGLREDIVLITVKKAGA
ncbi:MAG: SpoIIE family protein phosphatase [Planctomycetes bacterium]|nr:SpoIIE family protein phosphatase [Planctomycetota bacterium]